ncbi:MAG: branched-chain amino acid aminotransferase [Bacteroidia bacterium]|jgi:branched-chain amino acid aminotransferase
MTNALDLNRGFLYGDGFFETMRIINGDIPLWQLHMDRAKRTAEFLETNWPDDLNLDLLKKHVLQHNENNLNVVRLDFFRTGSGTYVPEDNALEYIFSFRNGNVDNTCFPLTKEDFELTVTQLVSRKVGVYNEFHKQCNSLSEIKSTSAIFYVKAAMFLKKQSNWTDLILLNEHGRVCEGLSSNILFKKGMQWFGSKAKEGQVLGVFQQHLESYLNVELTEITVDRLKEADSVLFTNAATGIRKVELVR